MACTRFQFGYRNRFARALFGRDTPIVPRSGANFGRKIGQKFAPDQATIGVSLPNNAPAKRFR